MRKRRKKRRRRSRRKEEGPKVKELSEYDKAIKAVNFLRNIMLCSSHMSAHSNSVMLHREPRQLTWPPDS